MATEPLPGVPTFTERRYGLENEFLGQEQEGYVRRQIYANEEGQYRDGYGGDLERQSFQERSALAQGATGTGTKTYSYWDDSRGVQVSARLGHHFELLPGGGVREVAGLVPDTAYEKGDQLKSSLFQQPTQGRPGGAPGEMVATEGFREEQLNLTPAAGKTIARYGQSVKNPTTGVDEQAGPGEILIEYTDGTVERRRVDSINQAGGTTPIGEFGRTAEELGIDRNTEIKGGAGQEVTRAPMSAAQALAAAQTPEEKDKVIQGEGLESTRNLEFIGTNYQPLDKKGQPVGDRRVAREGYGFYQEPDSDKILERPIALQSLAKETSSPSVLAERNKFSEDLSSNLSTLGLSFDEGAAIKALRDRPIPSAQELYSAIQTAQGVTTIKQQINQLQAETKNLDDKFADDVAKINENPWLTEGNRVVKIRKLEEKYEMKRSQLVARQQMASTLLQDARQEAQFLTGAAIQQANADRAFDIQMLQLAFEREDAKRDAQMKLDQFEFQKEESAADREFRKSESAADRAFQEKQFSEDIRQFNVQQARLGRSGGGGGTASERALGRLGAISGQVDSILSSDRNLGEQGSFTTIAAYRNARAIALNSGVAPDDFDSIYGNTLSPYDRLTYGIGVTTNISQLNKLESDDTLDFDSF